MFVNNNIVAASHIIPDADDTYDLGSSDKKFRNIHVDSMTISKDTLHFYDTDNNNATVGSVSFNNSQYVLDISANDKVGQTILTYDDKVSIGRYDNSSPSHNLDISGTTFISKETILNGDVSMNNNASICGNVIVNKHVAVNAPTITLEARAILILCIMLKQENQSI